MGPPPLLYRIGRSPDAWQLPHTSRFRGRFDDVDRRSAVLYASSHRIGPFVECLAAFQPRPGATCSQAPEIREWISKNMIGAASVSGSSGFVDVCSQEWISILAPILADRLEALGFGERLDVSMFYQNKFREIPQLAAKEIRRRGYSGVYYRSRLGNDIDNWAVFEPWSLAKRISAPILNSDPDLLKAIDQLGINFTASLGARS